LTEWPKAEPLEPAPDPAVPRRSGPTVTSPADEWEATRQLGWVPPDLPATRPWRGANLEPFVVGDGGRAFTDVVPALPTVPWTRPDTVVDGGTIGDLSVRAASVRGLSKRHYNKPRQDDYGLGCDEARAWLVAVVADGVGQGDLSHDAARAAVTVTPRRVADQLAEVDAEELDWEAVFRAVVGAIARRAEREFPEQAPHPTLPEIARRMATTLTVVVCPSESDSETRPVYVAWVGDSSVWLRRLDGSWECLTEIKGAGEEVSSSSVAALPVVPRHGISSRTATLARGEGLFVMSDGVGDPLGDGSGEVGEFLGSVWSQPPDMLSFAAHVGFARKSFDDDRTVVGIWTQAGPE